MEDYDTAFGHVGITMTAHEVANSFLCVDICGTLYVTPVKFVRISTVNNGYFVNHVVVLFKENISYLK